MYTNACKSDAMQNSEQCHRRRIFKDAHFRDDDFIVFSFGDDGGRILPSRDGKISTSNRNLLLEKEICAEEKLVYGGELKSGRWKSDQDIVAESVEEMRGSVASKRSDRSSGSFAFPNIGWDKISSPEKFGISMSSLQHSRKKKLKSLPFCCCDI